MNQTKVIIFTRHKLTEEQLESAISITQSESSYPLSEVIYDNNACVSIETVEQANAIIINWCQDSPKEIMVFGVFPPILRYSLRFMGYFALPPCTIATYESHNLQRSPEGGKPTFEFACWYETGFYAH